MKHVILIFFLNFLYSKNINSKADNFITNTLDKEHINSTLTHKNKSISTLKKDYMSDYVLKFWPKENVTEIKTDKIISQLTKSNIIGETTEFWGKPAFKPGKEINSFFEPKLNDEWAEIYFSTIAIIISESDYGVIQGNEDFEYIDRKNVISIKGGEATFEKWNLMCEKLKEITGDEYQGGWEIL